MRALWVGSAARHWAFAAVVGIAGDSSVQETQNGQTKAGGTGGLYVGRKP